MNLRGRPKLEVKNAKLATLNIRLTEQEWRQIRAQAVREGYWSMSQWARENLMAILPSTESE